MGRIFSGSYDSEDVHFLLRPVTIEYVDVREKERRIQCGLNHYSEMLSEERLPSAHYMDLFQQAMRHNAQRFALHIWQLARMVAHNAEQHGEVSLTLVSLARAGTPVGVLLKRSLALLGKEARHYSISIIRDRGVDEVALRHILDVEGRDPRGLVFVDGWTGKGVIGAELRTAIARFNARTGHTLPSALHVVADLCGVAEVSATGEDYLIPCSLLNAIVSGLVSRSVLNSKVVEADNFHACAYYAHWLPEDLSRWFVDSIFEHVQRTAQQNIPLPPPPDPEELRQRQHRSAEFLQYCRECFNIHDPNHVKPGIGEATRVLLRRVPHALLLRGADHADAQHLLALAQEKSVPVNILPELPYAAAALIRNMHGH